MRALGMVTYCKGSRQPGDMAKQIGRLSCRHCLLTVPMKDTGGVMPAHSARRSVDSWLEDFAPRGDS